ncbi:hypothetical protein AC578_10493 [Pseudocercospora eumusae]|uniref:Uncharacterized protein n=1 Tax=Pseudocercospora eumusae TaxID=321146 RepID=A0A139H8C3_9PEZI|nr:hypothetical protein AC578_10493 [Pseudocercospora eumusae]
MRPQDPARKKKQIVKKDESNSIIFEIFHETKSREASCRVPTSSSIVNLTNDWLWRSGSEC